MKIVISNKEKIGKYPRLMIARNEMIVLFSAPKIGVIIDIGKGAGLIGEFSNDFIMDSFKDFEGSINLSND